MQDDSQTEDVRRRIDPEVRVVGICDNYFGRHEARRAAPFVQVRRRIRPSGQPEVADCVVIGVVDIFCALEHDILWLEVAVDNAPVGQVCQAGQEPAA